MLALVATAAVALLAGCATTPSPSATPAAVTIVASTNVYGDLATTIGGSAVSVTSVITSPDQDPHEYQGDARTQLALSKADLVIENGGGYDDFMTTMLSASGNTTATVLDAVKLSGYDTAKPGFNEHVFYDYPTMGKLVDAIVAALAAADPADQVVFQNNGAKLRIDLNTLEDAEAQLKASFAGAGVAVTEPVPLYVLTASGLRDLTPPAFSTAIENGTDAPASALNDFIGLIQGGSVKAMVYNVQTTGPQTDAVLAAAKAAGIPAVPVSETLPDGLSYVDWQSGVIALLGQALQG